MPENTMTTVQDMPVIGVDMLVIAKMLTDTAEGATYATPVHCAGVTKIGVSDNGNVEKFYADNGVFTTYANKAAKEVSIDLSGLPLELQSEITGATYSEGLMTDGNEDVAPKYAIGYRRMKSDGSYRYVWMLKGSFLLPTEDSETKGQNINFQTTAVKYTAENRLFDGADRKRIDDNDHKLKTGIDAAEIAANWFSDPNVAFLTASE